MQTIFIEDKTSPGTISPTEKIHLVEALRSQAKHDFNTSPWVEHGYCKPIRIEEWNQITPPPVGSWNLILLDTVNIEGALGYHEDAEGGRIPVSYVGVKEAREDDTSIIEVASHEMIEMAVNPYVEDNRLRIVKHNNREYVVEPADPVESCGYAPLIVKGFSTRVANFVWPRYYGLAQTRKQLCQAEGYITQPFQLARNGYISSRPIDSGEEGWESTFGDKRTELPKWASRLPRIHGTK